MSIPQIAISYAPKPEARQVLTDHLAPLAALIFLRDVPAKRRTEALAAADVLLSWNFPRELTPDDFPHLGRVRLIQTLSAGVDHLPFAQFPPGAVVASNAGAYADPMAEHALALILALAKRLLPEHQLLARGEFDQRTANRSLRGSTAAIVGFGGIGKATARLLAAFGVRIIALNTSGRTDEPVAWVGTLADLERALAQADIVVLSLPLTRDTRGLIGARELARMKPDAMLINIARGALVDETALYEHLRLHPKFQAGIDAWWREPFGSGAFQLNYPFFELPNMLGSPHNSTGVTGILTEAAERAAENIARFLRGEPIMGIVNPRDYLPDTASPES